MESKNVSLPIDEIAMLFGQLMVDNQSKGSDEVKNSENIETGVGALARKKTVDITTRVEKVGDNYRIIQAVPSRKLSERAVTTSRAIDNASIVAGAISIVLLILKAT